MILWTSKIDREDEPYFPHLGRRAWRWIFALGLFYVDLHKEVLFEGSEWHPMGGRYYTIGLTRRFHLGGDHIYHDGPHCSFSLGFLHIAWSPDWCTKCMPDDEPAQEQSNVE